MNYHCHDCVVIWHSNPKLGDYVGGLDLITWALKTENFLQLVVEEKVRKIWSLGRTQCTVAGSETEGPHDKECRWPPGTEWTSTDSQWGNVGSSPTNTRGWIPLTTRIFLEADSSLQFPVKSLGRVTPQWQLCAALAEDRREPAWPFGQQNYEIVNGCGFKLLHLCPFVTAAIRNTYKDTEHQSNQTSIKETGLSASFRDKFCQNFKVHII